MTEAVRFEEVEIGFGDRLVHTGISFTLERGEAVSFLGPSGVGKTVLLKLMVGLLKPSKGRVSIFGEDITDFREAELPRIRQEVGFLFQGAALFDSLSVQENVAYALRERGGLLESELIERVEEKLQLVGLAEKRRAYPAELSGGQKKRVALARALAREPLLMLFDEPTTGLDPTAARKIDELIVQLNSELGMTTVSVTHDLGSARKISNRWLLFADGRLAADGAWEELLRDDEKVSRFIAGQWDESERA